MKEPMGQFMADIARLPPRSVRVVEYYCSTSSPEHRNPRKRAGSAIQEDPSSMWGDFTKVGQRNHGDTEMVSELPHIQG